MSKIGVHHFDPKRRRSVFPQKESRGKKRSRVIDQLDEAFDIVERSGRSLLDC